MQSWQHFFKVKKQRHPYEMSELCIKVRESLHYLNANAFQKKFQQFT